MILMEDNSPSRYCRHILTGLWCHDQQTLFGAEDLSLTFTLGLEQASNTMQQGSLSDLVR